MTKTLIYASPSVVLHFLLQASRLLPAWVAGGKRSQSFIQQICGSTMAPVPAVTLSMQVMVRRKDWRDEGSYLACKLTMQRVSAGRSLHRWALQTCPPSCGRTRPAYMSGRDRVQSHGHCVLSIKTIWVATRRFCSHVRTSRQRVGSFVFGMPPSSAQQLHTKPRARAQTRFPGPILHVVKCM